MTCLPERFIYGWIFSLRSDSKELIEYKRTCYNLLYEHFHGTIVNRKELLIEKQKIDAKMSLLKKQLEDEVDTYKQFEALKKERKRLLADLNAIDKELAKQPELFNN